MTTDPHGKRSAQLSCGEPLWFTPPYPKRGERIWCRRHNRWDVLTMAPPSYRTRCRGGLRGCSMGRHHGSSMGGATLHASRHVQNFPTHTVQIYDGFVLVDTITSELTELPMQETLADAPPF